MIDLAADNASHRLSLILGGRRLVAQPGTYTPPKHANYAAETLP
jgi:hypothetical protein